MKKDKMVSFEAEDLKMIAGYIEEKHNMLVIRWDFLKILKKQNLFKFNSVWPALLRYLVRVGLLSKEIQGNFSIFTSTHVCKNPSDNLYAYYFVSEDYAVRFAQEWFGGNPAKMYVTYNKYFIN